MKPRYMTNYGKQSKKQGISVWRKYTTFQFKNESFVIIICNWHWNRNLKIRQMALTIKIFLKITTYEEAADFLIFIITIVLADIVI